ncbi:hypothetical protein APHAL10511_002607 [Amanita phalloides]|nr:hypothetical protein APHAL10511_002607 [Amanita phalloides]
MVIHVLAAAQDNVMPQRGVKRKISSLSPHDNASSAVQRKLHHELKEIKKAAKKSRTFETRKIIKRLKSLRSKGADTSDLEYLEKQLPVLKRIDIEMASNTAFISKIRKNKQLFNNDILKTAIAEEIGSDLLSTEQLGASASRAQSRLLSSRTLAERIASALQTLNLIMNPLGGGNYAASEKVSRDATSGPEPASTATGDENGPETLANNIVTRIETGSETGWESGNDGEWESGSIEEDTRNVSQDRLTDASADKSSSKPVTKPGNARSSELQSTFLPSLSTGFIRGVSDESDWDESEAKITDSTPKKNRRGQRARRVIWEKKYGRNANHKKRELGEQMHSMKERQKKNTDSKRRSQNIHQVDTKTADTKADVRQSEKRDRPSVWDKRDQPLHPSWEAKKRMREKMAAGIVPSQGKKIVF